MRQQTSRRQIIRGLVGTVAATSHLALLAGCAGGGLPVDTTQSLGTTAAPATSTRPAGPTKVALLLPQTGDIQLSLLAKGLQQAAELAVFERNVPELQLSIRDDKGTPEGAAAAVVAALADGAQLILGPLFAESVKAAAPAARQAGVPIIAFSNDPGVAGGGVHLLSFFITSEATRIANHAVTQGYRRFALLLPDNQLGKDSGPAFRQAIERGGASIAIAETYSPGSGGIAAAFHRVLDAIDSSRGTADQRPATQAGAIDALYIPAAAEHVPRLVSMLRARNFDPARTRLLASSGWNQPIVFQEPNVKGAWFAAPDPAGWREFTARFGKAYNAAPPRIASLVHDAVGVAAAFASQPPGNRYTTAHLTRPSGFNGIDGAFRFSPTGTAERNLAILEVQPQGTVLVARPSPDFPPPATLPAASASVALPSRS